MALSIKTDMIDITNLGLLLLLNSCPAEYGETCLKSYLKRRPEIGYQDRLSLIMQVKSIASILQYFRPSLIYHLSLRPLFCLFMSGR